MMRSAVSSLVRRVELVGKAAGPLRRVVAPFSTKADPDAEVFLNPEQKREQRLALWEIGLERREEALRYAQRKLFETEAYSLRLTAARIAEREFGTRIRADEEERGPALTPEEAKIRQREARTAEERAAAQRDAIRRTYEPKPRHVDDYHDQSSGGGVKSAHRR